MSDTIGPRRVVTVFTFVFLFGLSGFRAGPEYVLGRCRPGIDRHRGWGHIRTRLEDLLRLVQTQRIRRHNRPLFGPGNAGNLSASLPLTYLVLLLGWRFSFFGLGGVSMLLGVLAWFFMRDRPEDKGWPPLSDGCSRLHPASGRRNFDDPPPGIYHRISADRLPGRPVKFRSTQNSFRPGSPVRQSA